MPRSRGRQRAHDEQHRVGAGALASYTWYGSIVKSLRRIGSSVPSRASREVGERAAEVVLLGEDRESRRAAALVGAHDLGDARALADRPLPTASGACTRRSARCRAATAPRRTDGPRRVLGRESARARRAMRSRLRSSSRARVASTRSVEAHAHAGASALRPLHVALQRVAWPRPSRSPPRPRGRPARSCPRGRPRRSRRRRSPPSARAPRRARRPSTARAIAAFSVGVRPPGIGVRRRGLDAERLWRDRVRGISPLSQLDGAASRPTR